MVDKIYNKILASDIVGCKPSDEPSDTLKFTNKKIHIPFYKRIKLYINNFIWNIKTHASKHRESDILFQTNINSDIEERFAKKFYWAMQREKSVTVYKNGDVIINNLGSLCGEIILFTNKGKKYILARS